LWVTVALGAVLTLPALPGRAAAQQDVEPNQSCQEARDLGTPALPLVVTGSLDTPPTVPDIDFFRLRATPGSLVELRLEGVGAGQGTLADPLLGALDSGCGLVAADDDAGAGLDARVLLTVPADGVLVVAATSCCDGQLVGGGSSSGSYRLSVTPALLIASISGRVVDAVRQSPLSGERFPFALVELQRCLDGECAELETVLAIPAASDGRFRFDQAFGVPLPVGTYRVVGNAAQHQTGQSELVAVGAGEARDVGDVALTPFTVQFAEIEPCRDLSVLGGTCHYGVRIGNTDPATPLDGLVWSLVQSGAVQFQAGKVTPLRPLPQAVRLEPGASRVFRFQFDVPSTVPNGTTFCPTVFVGQEPTPLFNVVGQVSPLFCVSKGVSGFTAITAEKEIRKVVSQQQMRQELRQLKP
jgi:hypothetical protein